MQEKKRERVDQPPWMMAKINMVHAEIETRNRALANKKNTCREKRNRESEKCHIAGYAGQLFFFKKFK